MPEPTLAAGSSLGPYQILGLIGAGGMGEVYKAHDPRLGRDVAIKVSHQQFTDRFSREARTIAALNHTNICHLYDVGPNYLVMEFVEGDSLSDLIKAGMTLNDAMPIITQLIDGIEAAHEKNITHRDLKPANIKITHDGIVKILDFGLAKVGRDPESSGPLDPENSPTMSMAATAAGTILGTAAYMAPEQAKGKQADRRADIWAFGVIVYEMLTGRRLFPGESAVEILTGVLHKEPDLSAAPPQVQPLLRWCLQKERKDRLQSIGDARILLSREIAEPAPSVATGPEISAAKSNRSKLAWIVAAAGILVAAGSIGWALTKHKQVPEVVRFEIHAPAGSKLPLGTPAISNDGKMIAYTVAGTDNISHLHVRSLDSTESRELPGTERAVHPFWSPDGKSLAFVSGSELKRIDISAGQPHKLTDVGGPWHGSWSAEGLILFTSRIALESIPAQGGQVQKRRQPDPRLGEVGMGFPEFLPDGKSYLLRVAHPDDRTSIEMASLDSSERRVLIENIASMGLVAPSPDGRTYILYMRDTSLVAHQFDVSKQRMEGEPVTIVEDIGRVANPALRPTVGVSPSGILAFQHGQGDSLLQGSLTWRDRQGKALAELPRQATGEIVRLSPDGKLLVSQNRAAGGRNLWITDLERGITTRLTGTGENPAFPIWSPDSKRIIYRHGGSLLQDKKLYVRDAGGAGSEKVFLELSSWAAPQDFASDSQSILYTTTADDQAFWAPLNSPGKATRIGSKEGRINSPRFSPDGKFIAYASTESGRSEVYVEAAPPNGGKWQISIEGGGAPKWRRDGRELYFFSKEGKLMSVDTSLSPAFSAKRPAELFQYSLTTLLDTYDVSPDGKRFLVFAANNIGTDAPITVVLNWWAALNK